MDIAALSMNLAQTNLLNDVGPAVLSKSLEQAQDTGSAITPTPTIKYGDVTLVKDKDYKFT